MKMTLDELKEKCADCTKCGLCEGRTNVVFGYGKPDADIMLIGEGPGENEDLQGMPFVGRSGQLLDMVICYDPEKGKNVKHRCSVMKRKEWMEYLRKKAGL